MKKIYSILIGLLLLTSLQGQILRYSNYTLGEPPVETPDYYDEYDTIYAAYVSKPHDTIATIQEALVYSLDTLDFAGGASVWDRADFFYVFASHDSVSGLINWVDPGTYDANVTGALWEEWHGFTGDGNDYLETNLNLSSAVHYIQNSATMGAYLLSNQSANAMAMGCSDGTRLSYYRPRYTNAKLTSRINTGTDLATDITTCAGLTMATRTASGATENFFNGSSLGTGTAESIARSTTEVYILCYNNNGTAAAFSSNTIAIAFICNGITAAEATAINIIIETYMDAIGTGVQ